MSTRAQVNLAAVHEAMLTVEVEQLRKAALVMARHILAAPATGTEALSEARRVANQVMAAQGPAGSAA